MKTASTIDDREDGAGTYRLEILSGLYAGVTQQVCGGRLALGSGAEADILLLEPDFAPLHAGIVLRGGTIRVEGLADDVAVAGVGPVPAGAARTVRLPATVEIGGIAIAWDAVAKTAAETAAEAPPAPVPLGLAPGRSLGRRFGAVRSLLARPAVPGIAAAGLLAVTVFLTLANPIAGAAALIDGTGQDVHPGLHPGSPASPAPQPVAATPQPAAADRPAPAAGQEVSKEAARAVPAPAPARPAAVDAAAGALREEIGQAGLLNVHVRASGGAVTASGTIEPAMTGRWEALQKAFDERFAGDVTLVNSVAVKAERLPASLGIEGVWRGPQPYIVVRGQRYLVGAVVDGGWTIRDIERDRVMLEREGRLVAMRF